MLGHQPNCAMQEHTKKTRLTESMGHRPIIRKLVVVPATVCANFEDILLSDTQQSAKDAHTS